MTFFITPSQLTEIALAIVGIVPAIVAALFAYLASHHSKRVNDAVNHTHKTGQRRMLDQVEDIGLQVKAVRRDTEELVAWRRTYDGCPWETGHGVKSWLKEYRELQKNVATVERDVHDLKEKDQQDDHAGEKEDGES